MRNSLLIFGTGLFLLFVFAELLPNPIVAVQDHPVIRLLLLLLVLASLSFGPVIGALTFLVVAALILERNHRKLAYVSNMTVPTEKGDPLPRAPEDVPMPVSPSIMYNNDTTPTITELPFEPGQGTGDNNFSPVFGSTSLNYKQVLPSSPLGAHAASVYENAHLA